MYSGEPEIQAKRKALTVLQDQVRRLLDSARDMSVAYSSLLGGDGDSLEDVLNRVRQAEEDVEASRRILTRELAEIGSMMVNREDLLRAAYSIEEVAGYISGIVFRLSQVRSRVLRMSDLGGEIGELVDRAVETVQRLSEVVRALAINPTHAIDLANDVQRLEREMDFKYRATISKIMKEVDSVRDMIMLKDIVERMDTMIDKCLTAADSMTIVALSL